MPAPGVRKTSKLTLPRVAAKAGISAALVILGCNSLQNAVANGDTRTISLHHLHTGEDLIITYKKNGRYDEDALQKINWELRDWRRNEQTAMDPRLIDLVWEVQRDVGSKEAIQIVCGYRAPGTNEMLRRRSRNSGVARFSQHTHGKAMDFYLPDAPLEQLRAAGLRLQRGGVGFYPTSGSPFVHLDVGNVRHWPRMTREQLVKIFPDGRTVHIPSDGQPLPGYALAMADLEKRGSDAPSIAPSGKRSVLAKLFGFGKSRDEDEDASDAPQQVASAQAPAPAKVAAVSPPLRPTPVVTEPQKPVRAAASLIPLPRTKAPIQLAEAQPPKPQPAPRPAQAASLYATASASAAAPADNVFDARGFWRGTPDPVVANDTKIELASADAKATGSIGPWPAPPERMTPPAGEAAIGYAAPSAPKIIRQSPMGSNVPRTAAITAGNGISVALKDGATTAAAPASVPSKAVAFQNGDARRFDDPWMRAMVIAPSLRSITTAIFGAADMRTLAPLMRRPNDAVAMTFSDDPHNGMTSDRFSGSAVVFVATTTFTGRTAALR